MISSLFVTPTHLSFFLFLVTSKTIYNLDILFSRFWILILQLAKISPYSNERSSASSWLNTQRLPTLPSRGHWTSKSFVLVSQCHFISQRNWQRHHQGSKTVNSYSVACDEQWRTCIKILLFFDATQLPVSLNGKPSQFQSALFRVTAIKALNLFQSAHQTCHKTYTSESTRCCNFKVLFNILFPKTILTYSQCTILWQVSGVETASLRWTACCSSFFLCSHSMYCEFILWSLIKLELRNFASFLYPARRRLKRDFHA